MTLANKRKVIEVLLCCSDPENNDSTLSAAEFIGAAKSTERSAAAHWSRTEDDPTFRDDWSKLGLACCYTEAAYRLIESSPTLRREWFGAR